MSEELENKSPQITADREHELLSHIYQLQLQLQSYLPFKTLEMYQLQQEVIKLKNDVESAKLMYNDSIIAYNKLKSMLVKLNDMVGDILDDDVREELQQLI